MNESGDLVDSLVTASRVLVAVAARSLAALDEDVTLAQYRTMVLVASRGPQTVASLGQLLSVTPATATRMCDRLEKKGLITRTTGTEDRRTVTVALTESGRDLIATVTARRRRDIEELVTAIEPAERDVIIAALTRLAEASGEPSDAQWALEWDL